MKDNMTDIFLCSLPALLLPESFTVVAEVSTKNGSLVLYDKRKCGTYAAA